MYGKGEWIIRIQANASSKSKPFPNKVIDRPLRKKNPSNLFYMQIKCKKPKFLNVSNYN